MISTTTQNPQPASFFVPVGIGVLVQMFCAGLVTAVTALGFSSPAQQSHVAANIENSSSAEPSKGTADAGPKSVSTVVHGGQPSATKEPATGPPKSTELGVAAKNLTPPTTPSSLENPAESEAAPAVAHPAQVRPLDDVRARSRLLKIAGEGILNEINLCRILVDDATHVALELTGGEFLKPREFTLQLEKQPINGTSCKWIANQVAAAGFDRELKVGEFHLVDQQLHFRWEKNADKDTLPFCRLRISAGSDTEVCDLWDPVRMGALKMNFGERTQKLPTFVPAGVQLPPGESLQLELSFDEWPEHTLSSNVLMLNKTVDLTFPNDYSEKDLLKIQLTLKVDDGQLAVHTACSTDVPQAPVRKGQGKINHHTKDLSYSDLERLTKEMDKQAGKYQRELEEVEKDLEKLQFMEENIESQMANGVTQALATQQGSVRRRVEQKLEERAVAAELALTFSNANSSMTGLADLCSKIEESGRIHFELIRPLEGGDSDVVIASSVSPLANAGNELQKSER